MSGFVLRFRISKSLLFALFAGLLVAIPSQIALAPSAQASILGTGNNTSTYGGGTGGSTGSSGACPTNSVVVGVAMNSVNGFAIFCRTLQPDGTLPAGAHTTSNTTKVNVYGGSSNSAFCPEGTAATILRIQAAGYPYGAGLSCQTPPRFLDTAILSPTINGSGTWVNVSCPVGRVVTGAWAVSGAHLDRIGAICAPFMFLTVSYNANGGTGTVPTTQTQASIGGSIQIAAQGQVARNGFRFGGWNTLASGLGTNYAPGASLTPSANTTLFAQWLSRVTYDTNTATSGTVPQDTQMIGTTAVTSLATNSGNLQRTGYTFGGWNTRADGTGTNFPVPTPATITETPYMHFMASNFNDATNTWENNGNSARNIPGTPVTASDGNIRGNPVLVTNVSGTNGSNKTFPAVQGGTGDGIVLGNEQLNSFTFCHVARYAGGNRGRIFAGVASGSNWLSGFWQGNAGVAHHQGWITSSGGWNDTNWRVQCS
ncbi:MAG: hypothetical protein EBS03_02780, partial [Actinobacteria bacterium]|nr:hypothetical protein [Actinomycetota bacterium]